MRPTRRTTGVRAVVTGGASGIGAAIAARSCGTAGATVAVLDLQPSTRRRVRSVTCDVSDRRVRRAPRSPRPSTQLGGLDVLVNNAGIGAQGTVEDNPDDEWRRVFDVNVARRRPAVPRPRCRTCARPGTRRIVNTCSIAATAGLPQRALYSATKGAVAALTLAMAADHIREGIRVNARQPRHRRHPVGRPAARRRPTTRPRSAPRSRPGSRTGGWSPPEEVAEAVAYLTSPLAPVDDGRRPGRRRRDAGPPAAARLMVRAAGLEARLSSTCPVASASGPSRRWTAVASLTDDAIARIQQMIVTR